MIELNHARVWLDDLLARATQPQEPFSVLFFDWLGQQREHRPSPAAAQRTAQAERRAAGEAERERVRRRTAFDADLRREWEARAMRVESVWTFIENVSAINRNAMGQLCCRIFDRMVWIPRRMIAMKSEVRQAGDTGLLQVRTSFARTVGIVEPN